jgi:catechol-2,3-dioxygenase/quercetin dioxygenase-like cupin family protein
MTLTAIQDTAEGLKLETQRASNNHQPDTLLLDDVAMASLAKTSAGCRNTGIHHVGLYAKDPAVSAEFYRDVLGMEVVGGSEPGQPFGATAFLSSRPDEESHEVALFANPTLAHVAFKVSSLTELRSLHAHVVERNIKIKFVVDHRVSFAFYFADPDDNMIEVYWPTGDLSQRQPQMEPLDLSQPDEILLRHITLKPAQAVAGGKSANEAATVSGRNQGKYVPAGTGRTYKSPIDQITFLITGEQTGGAFFMAEVTVPPGSGNRPHIHDREEESFYLQQGTLTIQVGDKTLNASPGDFVQLPRGVVHCFQNTGNVDAKFLVIAAPAGLEKFFEEAFYPAADWPDSMPPMSDAFMAKVLTAAAKYGLRFLPPA